MDEIRITAALIVRNEAGKIEKCLESLAGAVDEIVVVDTGSNDDTARIAHSCGAFVSSYVWGGDFAAARNAALDGASGTWILYIDADERLSLPLGRRLHDFIGPASHAGVMLRLHPRAKFTAYEELRLFLRDPRIRFEGRIHEQILPSVLGVCATDGKLIGTSTVALHHVGYEGDLSHKHRRNLPLLEQAVKEQPNRLYCWYHLGETLAELGRREAAERALLRGIAIAQERNTAQDRAEATLCYQRLAKQIAERGDDPRPIISAGLQNRPDDYCLRLIGANAEIKFGDPAAAMPELAALGEIDAEIFFDPLIAYDRRTFSLWPHALMGVANMRLGCFAEAEAAFTRAAASRDASPEEGIEYFAKAQVAAARMRSIKRAVV
jgi:glycosyltransferase involved in cell wall biosynthesis